MQHEQSVGIVAGLALVASTMIMSHSLAPLSRMLHVPTARLAALPFDDVTASVGLHAHCIAGPPAPVLSLQPVSHLGACAARRLRLEVEACCALTRPVTCAAGMPPARRS